jgi:hypothetical protein
MFPDLAAPEPGYFHRRDAEFAEVRLILFSGERPENKKKLSMAVYIFLPSQQKHMTYILSALCVSAVNYYFSCCLYSIYILRD